MQYISRNGNRMTNPNHSDPLHKTTVGDDKVVTDSLEKAIIQHFPDSIHSVDEAGTFIFTNRAAEKLLGYLPGELIGQKLSDLYNPEVLRFVEKGFQDLKATGSCSTHSAVVGKAGNLIPVDIRSFCIYTPDGVFQKTITIMRDLRNYMYALSKNQQDGGWKIQWASEPGAVYSIEWAESLDDESLEINGGIPANPPINSYTDYFERTDPGVYRITKA